VDRGLVLERGVMDSLASLFAVLLGLLALSSLVQTVFLVLVARHAQRLARRIDEIQQRFDRDISPSLENLARMTRNLTEVSDLAVLQARRIDALIVDTTERFEDVAGLLRGLFLRPLGRFGRLTAFLHGVRRGYEVYRRLGINEPRRAAALRRRDERYAEDEHLFI
jgi:hypothetical protein